MTSKSKRVPPQSPDIERKVLGAMLLDEEALDSGMELLDEEFFSVKKHRIIFDAMEELFDENEAVDAITVGEALKKKNSLEKIGGDDYLLYLSDEVIAPSNIRYHANIILKKYLRRQLIKTSSNITSRAYEEVEDLEKLMDDLESEIFRLSERRVTGGFTQLKDSLHNTYEKISEAQEQHEELYTGIPTGYDKLDEMTNGFKESNLIVIAGRPSMGKTAFALNVALHSAMEEEIPVAIFSLEMSKVQLAMRFLSIHSRVDTSDLTKGWLSEKEMTKIGMEINQLSKAPIYLDDTPNMGVLDMRAKARRLARRCDIGMVIVDYLQLMKGPSSVDNRQQEIAQISRSLKGLARELETPVVSLSQLNREVEKRGTFKRPRLADLRASGAIEQDADLVLFIYRPEVYNISEEDYGGPTEGITEIIVSKQRTGRTGTIRLYFEKEITAFTALSPEQEKNYVEDQEENEQVSYGGS